MSVDKRFICGVGRTFNYDSNGVLLWVGKTLINSAIDITTASQELRAGLGNTLQMVYFHSGALSLTQEEQQFNLAMIASTVGSSIVTGADVWEEETVALTGSSGTVVGTPKAPLGGTPIYGWATLSDGTYERFTFSSKTVTLVGQATGNVCVRYYKADAAARKITINSNFIPAVVRTVVEAQLFSGDPNELSTSTLIGNVQVEIPRLQLDGTAQINLTSGGVSSTPIKGNALESAVAGCSTGTYATITEIIDSANWYDNVTLLSMVDDTLPLTAGTSPITLTVWAIPSVGQAFIADNSLLTFTSGTPATATVGENTGIVTFAQAGSTVITIVITGKTSVGMTCTIAAT
jgi:hypothetical protein